MAKHGSDRESIGDALRSLNEDRKGVVLTGEVVDGKVVLDEASLRAIKDEFADAKFSFVAVNAPFDPGVRPAE